ncbi:MAG: ABC transporter substrate-binding protein, partial [Anaerolineae bacterium]
MKRTHLCLLALLACCCAVAACAIPTPTPLPPLLPAVTTEEPTPLPHLRNPVTIVFWHSELEGTPRGQLIAAFARRFAEECPWVTVIPVYAGRQEDLARKARVAVRAGMPPDLAALPESDIAALMQGGALTTLDAYLIDPELGISPREQADFFPGAWQSIRYPEFGNNVLALPYAKAAVALYYNRTLLQACGIEGPPATWEAFEKACLATRTLDARCYACVESATTFAAWVQSRGGSLLNSDQKAAAFNAAPGHDSLDLLLRLLDVGRAFRPDGQRGDLLAFAAGQVAFTMDLTDAIPLYV